MFEISTQTLEFQLLELFILNAYNYGTFIVLYHHCQEYHKNEFTVWNSAYLEKESFRDDIEIDLDHAEDLKHSGNPFRGLVKYYA